MRKGWAVTQTVIATILQAYALYFIYSLSDYIYHHVIHVPIEGTLLIKREVSFGMLLKGYHFGYLIALLAFLGGLMLLYEKKQGWVLSVLATALFTSFMLVSGRNGVISTDNIKFQSSVYYLLAAAGFAAMLVLLLQKPSRQKYRPTLANWLFIAGAIVILVIDKALIK